MPLTIASKYAIANSFEEILQKIAVKVSDGSYALQIADIAGGTSGGLNVNVFDQNGVGIDSVAGGGKRRLCVDAVLDVGDIEIGAVELKDGTTDQRAVITSLGQLLVAQGKIAGEDLSNDLMKVSASKPVQVYAVKISNPSGVNLIKAPNTGTTMRLCHYHLKADVPTGDITLEFTTAGTPNKTIGINNLQTGEPWSHTVSQGFIQALNADDDLRINVTLVGNLYVTVEYEEV